jgi:integrase
VDLDAGTIVVLKSKFRKSRQIPIHASVVRALSAYQLRRNQYLPCATDLHFFLTEKGTSLKWQRTHTTFSRIREELGWARRALRPRIHDLRHTFAVRTLLRWYQEGAPIGNRIAYLSTYLGHVKVSDTYWYFSAVPELMMAAAGRFEAHTSERQPEVGRI